MTTLTARALLCKAAILPAFLLCSCVSIPSPADRLQTARQIAASAGWTAVNVEMRPFRVTAFLPPQPSPAAHLTVYLEGDGLAWITGDSPSANPSPRNPVALRMAVAQRGGAVAYLARPCQYQLDRDDPACATAFWTNRRFAPEIVASTDLAVSWLKRRFDARTVELVGYSGGGALAVLVAAKRDDVVRVVTVAGNLDTDAWVAHHRVAALVGSLNPADVVMRVTNLRQVHFVGADDKVVPASVAASYASRFAPSARPEIRTMDGFGHVCCWAEQWPQIWETLK